MGQCGNKIAFYTLGCKLNFAESSALCRTLFDYGFIKCPKGQVPDIAIINTCSVTDTADKKGRQLIHKIVRQYPSAYIVVTGCYAQLKPTEIAAIEGVDLVLGANEKVVIEQFLENVEKKNSSFVHSVPTKEILNFKPLCSADDRTRHFLKVQDGCDYYCTYCTIPFARGRSRSCTIAEVLEVAKKAITDGAKEIVLTGVNTGDFGRHNDETFFDLVKALDSIDADVRYRISSIEPNLLTDEMIDYVAHSTHFAPHFHIPLQCGSDGVLKLMHRRYDTALFREKIEKIKAVMPAAFIGVDLMVGMRGETNDLFEESKSFVESLNISQLHVFTYSERSGTKALDITPIIPLFVRHERNAIMQEISNKKLEQFYLSQVGKSAKVLWEESADGKIMYGFTENYIKLKAPYQAREVNQFCDIIITNDNIVIN